MNTSGDNFPLVSHLPFSNFFNLLVPINQKQELEQFSQSYSKAASLSYAAGIADFDSVNNFSKDDVAAVGEEDGNSNLVQTKKAIVEAKQSLGSIIVMLQREL